MMGMYRFPANKRAKEATLGDQVKKLDEECREVTEAYMDMEDDHLLDETWDVIYTAEGILRKFGKQQVEASFERVRDKSKARGDIA